MHGNSARTTKLPSAVAVMYPRPHLLNFFMFLLVVGRGIYMIIHIAICGYVYVGPGALDSAEGFALQCFSLQL